MSIYKVIKDCFDGYEFTSISKRREIQVLFLARNMANLIKLHGIWLNNMYYTLYSSIRLEDFWGKNNDSK
jgi:hypothetical protein